LQFTENVLHYLNFRKPSSLSLINFIFFRKSGYKSGYKERNCNHKSCNELKKHPNNPKS